MTQPIRQPGSQLAMSTHKPRKIPNSGFSSTDLQKPQCFIIGMELMEMSLLDLINLHKAKGIYFSSEDGLDIILQIARGMCYLHDLGVVHAEIKSQVTRKAKADVFSFALTCAAILSLKEPFLVEAEHPGEMLKKIVECNLRPEFPKKCPNYDLLPLLEMCWATDPKERPDFTSICIKLEKYKQDLLTINLRSKILGV